MALYHCSLKVLSRSTRNTVGAVAYRAGCELTDVQTGEVFDYRKKAVQHVELVLPQDAPVWIRHLQKVLSEDRQKGVQALCDIAENAEKRIDAQVWREIEIALPRELTEDQNIALAREFSQDQLCERGMAALLNFHFDADKKTGEAKPHCHILVTMRRLQENGFSAKKEREWNAKPVLHEIREQWASYANSHLKLHGYEARIDHRSYEERGIDLEPQVKMGRGMREMESRIQELEGPTEPLTDKAKESQGVHFRNLYRLLRRPEMILDIVTKHQATFMWGDVQKIIHRHVDDLALFQRLEAKLQNSSELLMLKPDAEERTIYTTRTFLQAEKSLVKLAEQLAEERSHQVSQVSIAQEMSKANEDLQFQGFLCLSDDQVTAIRHMTGASQLSCIVGIAGAGKTTSLKVANGIWKENGYNVYGLAPTGKAAQNLSREGIPSTTLHKFLKDFEEGRCHYRPHTVLVLDEVGMVDLERFSHLLSAVQKLGVKLVTVGDGAQLQPVNAGPAFRLMTDRLGTVELNTVLRQKEEWQRDATVLFGKQQTQQAIQAYVDKGHVHIVEEKIPSLTEALTTQNRQDLQKLYDISSRISARMYREMAQDVEEAHGKDNLSFYINQHQDYMPYLKWKSVERATKEYAVTNASFEGIQKTDFREETKTALLQAWHQDFKKAPNKSSLILAFTNQDVQSLNHSARFLLKESGHLSKKEVLFTVHKQEEDDFGRQSAVTQEKGFAIGDRIIFTRNNNGLGVKNGTIGMITDLSSQTMQVKLETQDKPFSFAPNLNPYFDHGWAVTIHKSQGTTVDKTFVLASSEMSRNLSYVAMTRHREDVQVFGSSLDFWRPEKLPALLSQSGEKLTAGDYLDANSLEKLMRSNDKLITKVFTRLSNELHAMGAVSREAFWHAADRFLGITREKDKVGPEHLGLTLREEGRAEKLLSKQKHALPSEDKSTLEKETSVPPHQATRKHHGHDAIRESAEKPLSPGLLKETRNSDSSKELSKQEQRQRRDEQLQQDRQGKQVLEDQRRFVEKERTMVKQRDLSM